MRDPWLDNARFFLIALVVFGHELEPLLRTHSLLAGCYRFIYLFHMPAFAMLSGAVASTDLNSTLLRKIVFRLLLPYLLFQGLYAWISQAGVWPDDGPDGIATPYWLLWYLPSLACWRLLLPLFARLRCRLPLAVGVALAAGWAGDLGHYLSLSRTLVFFPFFLIGWQRLPDWCRADARMPARPLAVALLLALAALALDRRLDPRWLYGSASYAALHVSALHGSIQRLLLMAAATLAALAVFRLTPRRAFAWSRLGRGSLAAYLLHGFAIKLAIGAGAFALIRDWPTPVLLAMLGTLALTVTATLCSPLINRLAAPLTQPRWLERALWRPAD
ncbi:hypothetical protein LF63_0111215 [Oleiagrimonas soli]|uniref:Acyltransferase 3 domain-containing protein n=1 Tax=Oleiagrimonas soli TaxID=1543381 RepID=A0A099CU18_9GAMM|nr:hypothetical protein LF63_0111215 [Oleiagrimonas soli]